MDHLAGKEQMKPARLDALADGIFAIVMTLLVIEIKVPEIHGHISDATLWAALQNYGPIVMSYIISFAVLFTYWRAHHYIMGIYAKTVDLHLMNINALFFLFVAFVPFSSGLLGLYSETQIAIIVYSFNIILIGGALWWMRHHVLFTDHVDSMELDPKVLCHGAVRTMLPIVFATIAILLSFWNILASLLLLTLAVVFNLFKASTQLTDALGLCPKK